jgi:hypothetical protein
MKLPVYSRSRADLTRTAAIVVALLLTAATGAIAHEFRAADTRNENPTAQALRCTGRLIAGPAVTRLIERIRKVG